jgi:serine/threonine protein kinase
MIWDKHNIFEDEVASLKLVREGPSIMQLYDVYEEADQAYLVLEFMRGGELFDRIMDMPDFTEKDARDCTRCMLAICTRRGLPTVTSSQRTYCSCQMKMHASSSRWRISVSPKSAPVSTVVAHCVELRGTWHRKYWNCIRPMTAQVTSGVSDVSSFCS